MFAGSLCCMSTCYLLALEIRTYLRDSQVVGAYTGGGMSLVDAGMVPFQQAYLMICELFGPLNVPHTDVREVAMIFAILAGNHGMVSSATLCTPLILTVPV